MVFECLPLEIVCINHDSQRIPVKSANRKPGKYPYYGAQGIVDYVDGYIFDGEFVLIAEDGENLRSRKENVANLVSGKFWVNNHAHIISANERSLNRFLYYAINHSDISGYITGSTIPKLSQGSLNSVLIPLPPLPEQKAIAGLLGALDDKIDLNRRMNATLEAMARALFKDWFVDFGPTRAKMAGAPPTLAPDLWALFPDRLDATTGLPVGWREGTFGDIAQNAGEGITPDRVPPETPYIGLEHMPRRSIALDNWEGAGKVTSGKSVFRRGDMLFGKLRPYFHKVGISPLDGICSTDIVVLRSHQPEMAAYLVCCVSSDAFVEYTDKTSDGTKMPRTSWSKMSRYPLVIPADGAFLAFQDITAPLLGQIMFNIGESQTLAQLRDSLLPRLMSGQLRLRETESLVEGVV